MALRSNGAARFLLTKNSTLVLCRLGSWPCGGPCKVCVGVCECVLSTACPRCTPHGGLCIRVCVWRGGGTWFYFDGKGGSSWM